MAAKNDVLKSVIEMSFVDECILKNVPPTENLVSESNVQCGLLPKTTLMKAFQNWKAVKRPSPKLGDGLLKQ